MSGLFADDATDTRRLTLALLLALGLHGALFCGVPVDWRWLHAPAPRRFDVVLLPPLERPKVPEPPTVAPEPAESGAAPATPKVTPPVAVPLPAPPTPPPAVVAKPASQPPAAKPSAKPVKPPVVARIAPPSPRLVKPTVPAKPAEPAGGTRQAGPTGFIGQTRPTHTSAHSG